MSNVQKDIEQISEVLGMVKFYNDLYGGTAQGADKIGQLIATLKSLDENQGYRGLRWWVADGIEKGLHAGGPHRALPKEN